MAETSSDSVRYARVNPQNSSEQSIPLYSNEKAKRSKSWRAPATILSSLLMGLGLALAHHFMNVQLDGKALEDVKVSQAWISRFSTALAIMAKTAFTISVGAAFVQRQWLRFRRQSFKIGDVDAVTSAIGNPLGLFSSTIWFHHPILVLIAMVSWAVPFAAIVAPGSLSLVPVRTTNVTTLPVPQPLYNGTNYGLTQSGGGGNSVSPYRNIYKLAYATASSGQPVPLPSRYENQTYHLQFNGPAVRCGMADYPVIQDLSSFSGNSGGNKITFASWVPGTDPLQAEDDGVWEMLDPISTDAARLFVMSSAGSWNETVPVTNSSDPSFTVTRVNVTECLLFNATYDVDFGFQYPRQTRNVSISSWLNPVEVPKTQTWVTPSAPNATAESIISYSAMMNAYGKLFVGIERHNHYSIAIPTLTSWNIIDIDWSRSEAVQTGLEQLFQNFTLSLLSDSGLIKNETLAEFIPVTVESWPITYVYDRSDIYLAYGLSFLCTCICAAVGLHAFFVNHDSYQNVFSTFLRVTNIPELQVLIGPTDTGADPLPNQLAQARFKMVGEEDGSKL